MNHSTLSSGEKQKARSSREYFILLFTFTALSLVVLAFLHVHGTYVFPPGFDVLRRLFHSQYAFFGGAVLAAMLYVLHAPVVPRIVRRIILAFFYFCFVWVGVWVFVHRVFGIELSPGLLVVILVNQAPISEMGVTNTELAVTLFVAFALIAAMTAVTERFASRQTQSVRKRGALLFAGLFLFLHVPLRAYVVHYLNQNNYAVLAYDDTVPFSLRTERLLPGRRDGRLSLPSIASADRSTAYLNHLRAMPRLTVPRRRNILWINVESLRFDAIDEKTMPNLWKYRDQFQIALNAQHWSDANATHFAVFSMLTGLSGYQLPALFRAGLTDPFLALLQSNGYRLRFGKKAHIESADLLQLLPAGTVCVKIDTAVSRGDPLMVDSYLQDRRGANQQPRFDFLALDTPHWPYWFTKEDALFQPAPLLSSSSIFAQPHALLTENELDGVRNRYRNACYAADREIGRTLDDLKSHGGFADTIVILVGDHGEEFQERGQITHSSMLNDYQGRTVLWMHLPDMPPAPLAINVPTIHIDIVPTVLESLGFSEDVLYTQGRSLLGPIENRPMLSLCEQGGVALPQYRCLVSANYVSRWRWTATQYLFSGIQRRDGAMVEGKQWLEEVQADYRNSAEMYELPPDVSQPPRKFQTR
ncbi:MAG: hypothetical protein JWO95_751 [Verrucomicrobiales bacterium]|nr:hypothetical protein [Verrucomicrobiales bacterium]